MFHHEKGFLFGVPINISDAWGKHARMKWVNGIKILLTHGYSWRNFLPANLPWIFDHHFSTFHGYISLGNKKVLSGHFVYPPNSSCKMSTTSEGLKRLQRLRGPVFWCGVFFTPLLWWPLFSYFHASFDLCDCWPHINHPFFTFWFFAGKTPWRSCSACHLPRCFRWMRSQLYRLGA